jgi:hypothetical protein
LPTRPNDPRPRSRRRRPDRRNHRTGSASRDYDKLTAQDIAANLNGITDKIAKLTSNERWSGYDEQRRRGDHTAVADGDSDTELAKVGSYEREHKNRRRRPRRR